MPDGLLVELDEAMEMPDDQLVIVSTGSQGEPLSALSRMARGDHRQIAIRPDDTVILASSLIPGNETAVFGVINGLTRLGATVVHQGNAKVHVSGHAPAGELLFLYNAVRPSNVMPVHGEWRHLRANAGWPCRRACPRSRSCSPRTAWSSTWSTAGRRSPGGSRSAGSTWTGSRSATSASRTLADRLVLGEGGFIAITVAVDSTTGRAVSPPTLSGRGFSDDPKALDAVLRWSRTSCRAPRPRASPTPTASRSRCAGSSASGWGRPTAAAR